jgi:outer membrane lipoprotein carrier protein
MRRVLAFSLVVLGLSRVAGQATPSAADLADRLQARYDTVKSFTADYTLSQQSAGVPQTETLRGTVRVRKPGCLNFSTTSPTPRQVVSDGVQIINWDGGRQADRARVSSTDTSTALMFLAGRGNLNRDFTPSLPAGQPDGEWRLALAPKTPQSDFVTLTLFVDRRTLALNGYETVDSTGGRSTMRFTNLKENVPLPDSDFVFKRSGVKVVDR